MHVLRSAMDFLALLQHVAATWLQYLMSGPLFTPMLLVKNQRLAWEGDRQVEEWTKENVTRDCHSAWPCRLRLVAPLPHVPRSLLNKQLAAVVEAALAICWCRHHSQKRAKSNSFCTLHAFVLRSVPAGRESLYACKGPKLHNCQWLPHFLPDLAHFATPACY